MCVYQSLLCIAQAAFIEGLLQGLDNGKAKCRVVAGHGVLLVGVHNQKVTKLFLVVVGVRRIGQAQFPAEKVNLWCAIVGAGLALHCGVKLEQAVPCGLADWVVVDESVHDFFFTG